MSPEAQELITRIQQLISNPNVNHNPYFPNREQWVKANEEKIKFIIKNEKINVN